MTVFEILPDFSSTQSVVAYFGAMGVQIVIFLLALVALNYFVFAPVFKILRSRKENIDETELKTREFFENNTVLLEEFRWRMDGASQLAEDKRDIAILIGRCRADMLLTEVRRETNRDLDNVVKSAEGAYLAVAPVVEKDVSAYGENIANKILGE